MKKKMTKQACWFLIVGTCCMSFTTFTRHFINTPESIEDFLKGFGITLMVAGLYSLVKNKPTHPKGGSNAVNRS